MTWLNDRRTRVLRALRAERLSSFDIAADICESNMAVRGDLQDMRREQLVRFAFEPEGVLWELTPRGHRQLTRLDQLELGA